MSAQATDATVAEQEAIDAMYGGFRALRRLGWREAKYIPRDGSRFLCIELGSIGIHVGAWIGGEGSKNGWPGSVFVEGGDDLWPSSPILWKPLGPQATPPPAAEPKEGR